MKITILRILLCVFLPALVWWGCPFYHAPQKPAYLKAGAKAKGVYHRVKRGETLWRIAKTYGVNLQSLAEINNIDDPAKIKVDQKIFIPGAARTKKINVNNKDHPSPPPPIIKSKEKFVWPVQGKVVAQFGVKEGLRYEGIDIAAPLGTPVKAAGEGEVVYEGNLKGYGNLLIIKHKNNFKTIYAYNHVNLVPVGRKVKKGEPIAKVGNSGRTPDPCLHFEIRDKVQARNPLFFLP